MDAHLQSPDTRNLKHLGGNLVLKFKKSIYLFSVGRNQSSKICPFLTPIVSAFLGFMFLSHEEVYWNQVNHNHHFYTLLRDLLDGRFGTLANDKDHYVENSW